MYKPKEDIVTTEYPDTLFLVKHRWKGDVFWLSSQNLDRFIVGHPLSLYRFATQGEFESFQENNKNTVH